MKRWDSSLKDVSPGDRDDGYGPPRRVRRVRCLHCGEVYSSKFIKYREDVGLWVCPVTGCDGRGFGFDIHPVGSRLFG